MPSTNTDNYFSNEQITTNLKQKSLQGAALVMGSQGIKLVLSIATIAILARLLSPSDFGLVAMVTVITNFIFLFKDLGLTMATVQKPQITHEQVSSLFWTNLALGLLLALLTVILAPLLGSYYKEPRVIEITLFLSIGFIFGGLTVQHQAILRRHMNFRAITIIDVIALLISDIGAIASAYYGAGYWALVIKALLFSLFLFIGSWAACSWRPGKFVRNSGIKDMLTFGGNLAIFNVLNYFSKNVDKLLLGRYTSTSQLGLYSRAHQLILLPVQQISAPITGVANPTLSRLQDDQKKFNLYYLKAVSIIAYLTMPIMAVAVPLAEEIIFIFLGKQWEDAVPLFKVLAVAAFWQPIVGTLQWVLVSTGQTSKLKTLGLILFIAYSVAVLIGLQWGLMGVAISYSICATLLAPILFIYGLHNTFVNASDVLRAIEKPIFLSAIIALFVYGGHITFIEQSLFIRVALTLLAGLVGLLLSVWLVRPLREEVFSLISNIKSLRNIKKSG